MRINKHDTNGVKPLLGKGELGYDDYTAGGDAGRVYVGTGSTNIGLGTKSEVASKVAKVTSTDNAIVRFNGTTGDVQNSGVIIDDNNNVIQNGTSYEIRGTNPYLQFSTSAGVQNGYIQQVATDMLINVQNAGVLAVKTNNIERMRIDAAGNLGIGTSSPSARLDVGLLPMTSASSNNVVVIRSPADGANNSLNGTFGICFNARYQYTTPEYSGAGIYAINTDNNKYGRSLGLLFKTSALDDAATERMRIDSAGNVGIGVTPVNAEKLQVKTGTNRNLGISDQTTIAGAVTIEGIDDTRASNIPVELRGSTLSITRPAGTTAVFDANGNLGLGVTPNAWKNITKALQIGSSSSIMSGSDAGTQVCELTNNSYLSDTGYKYINNGPANLYLQAAGSHKWYSAPSGTAGNALTWTNAMTLDASGVLNVQNLNGTQNFSKRIIIGDTTGAKPSHQNFIEAGSTSWGDNGYMAFGTQNTEKMRLSTSGNLLIGTTTDNGVDKLQVNGSIGGTSFNSITGLSSTAPIMNGAATVGTSTTVARADHIHASDTTKANLAGATFTGNVSAPLFTGGLSGNASSATYQSNSGGATCDAKFKQTPAHGTSFSECNGVADAPNTGWWMIYSIRHSNASNYWGTQIAYGWEDNANTIYQRNISAGTWSAWTRVDVSSANITELANNAGFITSSGRAYPRRADNGGDLNFYWSGQAGQPSWLWGGNDGNNMYVYNPSNFSVNYANSAGSVVASEVIKFDSGTTEGTDLYTFNGSTAKTINIKAGTNVTLTKTAGTVTISANDTSVAVTEITGMGTGASTFLATPTSANLAAMLTDETGSGANVFANSPTFTGSPTAPTPTGGDSSTKLATTAFATGQDIGVGQTWQDMTASRAYGVTYTNNTGKPIMFSITTGGGVGIVSLVVNSVTVGYSMNANGILTAGGVIVPMEATYGANIISGTPNLSWKELR